MPIGDTLVLKSPVFLRSSLEILPSVKNFLAVRTCSIMTTYAAVHIIGLLMTLLIIGSIHCQGPASLAGPNICGEQQQDTLLACPLGSRCVEVGETSGGRTLYSQSCQTFDGRILFERKLERYASPTLVGKHIATSEVRPYVVNG